MLLLTCIIDSTFFVEYAGDYYFDVTQEAARVDYSSIDDNSKSFSVIVRYDQVCILLRKCTKSFAFIKLM